MIDSKKLLLDLQRRNFIEICEDFRFDYEEAGYEETSISKLTISLNGNPVDPLGALVHKSNVSG